LIFGGIEDLYLEGDIYGNITRAKILNYLSFFETQISGHATGGYGGGANHSDRTCYANF
jgi:hypothetical protein